MEWLSAGNRARWCAGRAPRVGDVERYLQFFQFHPLRKRLQNTRLKFLWRVLRSPAKLGRALLLGTLDFEKEGRVPTAWDRLIEEDLQLFGYARGGDRSKAEWFKHMWQVDEA